MAARPEISFDPRWLDSAAQLEAREAKRVLEAVRQFAVDPRHPALNLHPVHRDPSGRLYSFRASRELRVLVAKDGDTYIIIEVGHHDAVYERAERSRFVVNPRTRYIGLVDRASRDEPRGAAGRHAPEDGAGTGGAGVLDHWNDGELTEAGFTEAQIAQLRVCRNEEDLCDLGLDEEAFDWAVDLLATTPEQWRAPSFDPAIATEGEMRRAIVDFGAVAGMSPLYSPEEIAELAAAPIEEWMVFLHPDQRGVVERSYQGPARVRGSAGTGKTVVALHRAAALARLSRDGSGTADDPARSTLPILFTTYIKSLPPVFTALFQRLPGTRDSDVEFVNIDKLAFSVCDEAGDRPVIDPKAVGASFTAAWREVVGTGKTLTPEGVTRDYVREEIAAVIKGRGLRSLDEYLAVERTGRRTPLPAIQREQIWHIRRAWDRRLTQQGILDFPDVILRARDHARRRPAPRFRAAIIDEAQDLTLVGLQLVRSLVNGPDGVDVPNGLLIVGDGAQRIYPGGFTLRQAGVEVRGRTTVLRRNYRNTHQIITAALAVAGDEPVEDLEENLRRGDADAESLRRGATPALVQTEGFDDEMRFVADEIRQLVDAATIGYGDIAVAVATNRDAKRVRSALSGRGIPTQDLSGYEGTPVDEVKVGTHFRIKGLEFKVVFLPLLGSADFPRHRSGDQCEAEHDEQRSRALSQLYVAMTRARDGLFVLCTGDPGSELQSALDHFEVLDV